MKADAVDVLIVAAAAATVYSWLCATVSPIALGLNHVIATRGARRAWLVLGLAAGSGLVWMTIATAAALLATVLMPAAVLALVLNPVTIPAVSLGVIWWAVETMITARLPRIPAAVELGAALALLCVLPDDSRIAPTERLYGPFLIDEAAEPRSAGCRVPA